MIAFFPSNAGKASSRWYVLSFNSAFLSSTTEGDIIRSLLPIDSLLKALYYYSSLEQVEAFGATISGIVSVNRCVDGTQIEKAAIIQSWLILYYVSKCSQKSLYQALVYVYLYQAFLQFVE